MKLEVEMTEEAENGTIPRWGRTAYAGSYLEKLEVVGGERLGEKSNNTV